MLYLLCFLLRSAVMNCCGYIRTNQVILSRDYAKVRNVLGTAQCFAAAHCPCCELQRCYWRCVIFILYHSFYE